MSNPLIAAAEEHSKQILALFKINSGRLSHEVRDGEKADFIEIKVFNDEAKLAGIVWYFGHRRAYIQDVRNLVARKKKQMIPFFMVAKEGSTSAGKKELKTNDIELVRNLEDVKVSGSRKKKKKKKKESVKTEEISIKDDMSLTDSSPLVTYAKSIMQRNEPELINMSTQNFNSYDVIDLKGYTQKELISIVRIVELESVGVNIIRDYYNDLTSGSDVSIAMVSNDKFTPSARKEASSYGINLISLKDFNRLQELKQDEDLLDRLTWGVMEMLKHLNFYATKRKDKEFISIETGPDNLGTYLNSENDEGETVLTLIPTEDVVRVATIRAFKEQLDRLNVEQGWIIAVKRFTYTADREATNANIKLLKKNHPIFNIFTHHLVPIHEKMAPKEIKEMLIQYNAKLHQLPRIYEDDHGVIAINAKAGDVLRILRTRDSNAYRLVIRRPQKIH